MLKAEHITKQYQIPGGGHTVFDAVSDVSIELGDGGVAAIVGINAAGVTLDGTTGSGFRTMSRSAEGLPGGDTMPGTAATAGTGSGSGSGSGTGAGAGGTGDAGVRGIPGARGPGVHPPPNPRPRRSSR